MSLVAPRFYPGSPYDSLAPRIPPDITEVLTWNMGGHDIRLEVDPAVFRPTITTTLLATEILRLGVAGRSLLDLGCGSGPIAIAMAQAGASEVFATDLMPEACALTSRNVRRNGVSERVKVACGDLFAAVAERRFDIIVDDVSGVAEEVAVVSSWFPPEVPLGGTDGTSLAIAMLRQSRAHLNPGGLLYFPVLSLSDGARIVAVAQEMFGAGIELVTSRLIPFNQELKDHLPTLERLRSRGLITFEQVRSRLCWSLDIYRATGPG
jgi:SAM-dependent methyltransferase